MARLSMRDVAARAQVSIGTVSNVVNNPDIVLPATREKVQQAIADLGWVPNQQAQQLRAGRGRTIGLAVMDVTNPFFADLLRAAQDVLFTHGFHATIGDANIDEARQTAILRTFLQQRVRGVILGPIGPQPSEVGALAKAHIPTVLVDRAADSVECCAVGVDDVAGGRIAIEHLVSQGHRRVAFVGGPSSLKQIRDRLEGAQAAALAGGADLLSISVPQLDFASGRLAADQVVLMDPRARPTGVFCANDLVAIAFLQGLTAQGLRVPDDIAIVGYDNIDFAAAAAVPLSSVAQPRQDLGRTAADLLLAEIADADAGREHVHQSVSFTPTLVVRASSALTR